MKSDIFVVGHTAPDFELPTQFGTVERLSQHRNRPVVLIFYRGNWCPVCRRQLGQLCEIYPTIRRMGADVLAISSMTNAELLVSPQTPKIPFSLLADGAAHFIRLFGLADFDEDRQRWISRPATIIVDPAGVIRFAHIGEHSRDRPACGAIILALETINNASPGVVG